MNQDLIIGIIFSLAITYLIVLFWKRMSKKSTDSCGEGCSGCSAINVDEIEKSIK